MIALTDAGRQTGLAIMTACSVVGVVVAARLARRYGSFEGEGYFGNVLKALVAFTALICCAVTLVAACTTHGLWTIPVAIGVVLVAKFLPWPKKRPIDTTQT